MRLRFLTGAAGLVLVLLLFPVRALASPPWTGTSAMPDDRAASTANLLPDGRVLIAGGYTAQSLAANALIFDPARNSWSVGPAMIWPRTQHTATSLSDGRVLIAGGVGAKGPLKQVEIYDPTRNRFVAGPAMNRARLGHTATLLRRDRVLIVGGEQSPGPAIVEIFDPDLNRWLQQFGSGTPRFNHTATLLNDGRVLIAGGGDLNNADASDSAELFDTNRGSWLPAGHMLNPRMFGASTLLPDGRVLVVGGQNMLGTVTTAEVYDPRTDSWSDGGTPGFSDMPQLVRIQSGRVLSLGYDRGRLVASVYDPSANLWIALPPPDLPVGSALSMVRLSNGRVLALGQGSATIVDPLGFNLGSVNGQGSSAPASLWLRIAAALLLVSAIGSVVFARLGDGWRLAHRMSVLALQLSGIVLVTWVLLSMAGVQPSLGQTNTADSGAAQARELALLNQPVLSVLTITAERSITLMAFAAAWATFIGIGLASVNTAVRERHFGWALLAAGALWITPTFMLAILVQELQAVIAGQTGLVVAAGFGDVNGVQIFWASVVLGLRPVAYLFRHSRNLLQLETLRDYVRTAQAKGLDWRDVVFRHIFRVALPGLLTIWLNSFRLMIGALPLVEFFFGYPGLGRVLVLSLGLTYLGRPTDVGHPHGDLALGLVLIMAVLLLAVEVITRLLQEAVDPRLRAVRAEA